MKVIFQTLLICLIAVSFGQIKVLDRLEYDENDDYYGFTVTTFENKNLLVKSKKKLNKKTYQYRFELFNQNLKKIGEHEVVYDKGYTDYTYHYTQDACYTLRSYWKKGLAKLYTLDLRNFKSTVKEFAFPKKSKLQNLVVFGDIAYFKVRLRKDADFIRKYNLKTGKFDDIQTGTYDGKDIAGIYYEIIGEGDDKELLLVRTYYHDNKRNHIVQRFDERGSQIGNDIKLHFNEKYVQSLSFKKNADKNHFLITGACSSDNDYKPSGVFYAKIELTGKVKFEKYMSFDEIENFYSYLTDKRQAKIEKKKAKAIKKGKEFELEYNVASHDIYEHDGVYYYIGEFYYATYRTECTTYYSNGQAQTRCRQVFDGYKYTHAVIQAFDESGKERWSNTFEMNKTYKPYSVQRFVRPSFHNANHVDLMFVDYAWLESVTFKNGKIVGEPRVYSTAAKTDETDEEVKRSSSGTMDFWHDDIAYIYGWQKVKDSNERIGNKKRKVYFINIVEIDL